MPWCKISEFVKLTEPRIIDLSLLQDMKQLLWCLSAFHNLKVRFSHIWTEAEYIIQCFCMSYLLNTTLHLTESGTLMMYAECLNCRTIQPAIPYPVENNLCKMSIISCGKMNNNYSLSVEVHLLCTDTKGSINYKTGVSKSASARRIHLCHSLFPFIPKNAARNYFQFLRADEGDELRLFWWQSRRSSSKWKMDMNRKHRETPRKMEKTA